MTLTEQKEYIKKHAMDTPLKKIAKIIGRSSCFVGNEMKRQGIIVPQYIRDRFRKESCFKKGQVPFNKGIPQKDWMSENSIRKTQSTRFKKGNLPHNTKKDYELSLRRDTSNYAYYYIRVEKAKWVLYHRWLWVKAYGIIPKGHNIQFKDGNTLNCDLSNLYMIKRSDQSIVNKKGGKQIPHQLQKTILLINSLKNKIDEKQNN